MILARWFRLVRTRWYMREFLFGLEPDQVTLVTIVDDADKRSLRLTVKSCDDPKGEPVSYRMPSKFEPQDVARAVLEILRCGQVRYINKGVGQDPCKIYTPANLKMR
ncbi:MAG: hypothetical protein UV82_C0013G0006 [Candidatus Magasanikbacteria bacterium GW2011_GWD2_43_18]|uniref:Uncharacterized protein n=1 Tax=Candidatus Magasanikbacteria bacterium GW2011_GWE2_42_7 TaxID=1619052 RepID=A0A0G1ECR8_9BACT|nr:MAG: hypothetical protein UV18_C0009G0003 [Candidatus Magasanikbacteria bacterium GW2011_GWC2_42_27]KKS72388.1 MAG: hypothetical protein UV42_C0009G0005 [Candidatus Magasanikbacteria bacterium GW2011_GWE2_42_7]KKT03922.1 MAG: hypothetical protein UV82_C0013G0006 [Candidatus Magasanikbacteria bacterium GW2011_GWD2_43_18]KKT25596.1 MAG: hypothetical protein UW10_C0006G0062 [Candidatus Magasanikbacteria bacterium GW2011_GWA2_43_9]HBB37775.1 hypothetical protein [Candidatus Magasanikbacteria bac